MKTFSNFLLITVLSLLLFGTSLNVLACESSPLTPIDNLFDAMREHNSDKLLSQFTKHAVLTRVTKSNIIKPSNIKDFAASVAKSSKYLDEKIFNVTVKKSGNLASVWTPFAFYLDGKLSHCGVNSFQLIQKDGHWKIHFLIDNAYQGDCLDFIKQQKTKIN
jgi:hypothetical protein